MKLIRLIIFALALVVIQAAPQSNQDSAQASDEEPLTTTKSPRRAPSSVTVKPRVGATTTAQPQNDARLRRADTSTQYKKDAKQLEKIGTNAEKKSDADKGSKDSPKRELDWELLAKILDHYGIRPNELDQESNSNAASQGKEPSENQGRKGGKNGKAGQARKGKGKTQQQKNGQRKGKEGAKGQKQRKKKENAARKQPEE